MPDDLAARSFVEQALANLVDQFARPLDLLRELVQNAVDAGSPRIEVWTAFDPIAGERSGVLRIGVDDHGEGMDERIVDEELTRLFASSKEGDATRIGKFGIGFTSVFAIRPEAVLVRTGRHGEGWELLFHPDRTFDKVRLHEPVHGTSVVLFKRLAVEERERWTGEIRAVLGYWCEHVRTPITFEDRTGAAATRRFEPADDPFAAFEALSSPAPERVDRPLGIDGVLVHEERGDGVHVVVGYPRDDGTGSRARYGFYNGGLTLLHTSTTDVLGPHAERLRHLSFKVEHDRLEHTLTRDNVRADEHWRRALEAVVAAADRLRERLAARIARAVTADEPLEPWHALLAAELRSGGERPEPALLDALVRVPVFRTVTGEPVTPLQVAIQEYRVGAVLVHRGPDALTAALGRQGLAVIEDSPVAREVLERLLPRSDLALGPARRVAPAESVFVVPSVLPPDALAPDERGLVAATEELLRVAVGLRVRVPGTDVVLRWVPPAESVACRLTLRVGDFGGLDLGAREALALDGPDSADVFLRRRKSSLLPAFLRWRCLLANRHHPTFRAHLLAWSEDRVSAAYGLASALLVEEGVEGEAAHRRLLEEVAARLATPEGVA